MYWLKALRKEKEISQKAVAAAVGIAQPTYCNIEKGKRRPGVDVAKRIACVLGFNWTWFYESQNIERENKARE